MFIAFLCCELVDRNKLEIREDSKKKVVVVGLKEYVAESLIFIEQIIAHSAAARSTGTMQVASLHCGSLFPVLNRFVDITLPVVICTVLSCLGLGAVLLTE